MTRRTLVGGLAGVAAAGLIAAYLLTRPSSSVVAKEPGQQVSATPDELREVSGLRVYFGHQSVGDNMIAALPAVYGAASLAAPEVVQSTDPAAADGPVFQHAYVGENGDPLGKIAAFDSAIRGGLGDVVDVAAFKFCYVDFHSGDDVEQVFEAYRDTMAALEREYPDVTFVYSTVPLTTERDATGRAKDRIKRILGRHVEIAPEHNVVREQLNQLIRAEYADSGRLFDIAAVQSTSESDVRTLRSHDGSTYYAMEDHLASDPGHLNPDGATIVASAFLATIAQSAG